MSGLVVFDYDPNGCPHCGGQKIYSCKRSNGASRYRCGECRKDFSPTSSAAFRYPKMPAAKYRALIDALTSGKSALQASKDVGVQYRTAWHVAKRLRAFLNA